MVDRCRNCGKAITSSNITFFSGFLGNVCSDCMKQNTGINFLLMKERLDKEELEEKRKKEADIKESRRMDNENRRNKFNDKIRSDKEQRELIEHRELAKKLDREMELNKFEQEVELNRLHNSPEYIEKKKEEKEKELKYEFDMLFNPLPEYIKEKRIKKENDSKATELRKLWVYLLKKGEITAFDDIKLNETGDRYTVIPMGKSANCPEALKYREENKIDTN